MCCGYGRKLNTIFLIFDMILSNQSTLQSCRCIHSMHSIESCFDVLAYLANLIVHACNLILSLVMNTFTTLYQLAGPSNNTGIIRSAAGISETKTFPAGSSSITFNFNLTDDNVGLEAVESYIASLQLVGSPLGIQTGVCLVETTVNVEDDESMYKLTLYYTIQVYARCSPSPLIMEEK